MNDKMVTGQSSDCSVTIFFIDNPSVFPGQCTGLIRIDLDIYLESLFRKQFLDILRPLHHAQAAAVKIVIQTYLYRFREFVDTIEIKMIHRLPVSPHILVHDGKSR